MLDNPSLCNLNHISICFIQISTRSPANSLFPSGKAMFFFKVIPGIFGRSVNLNITSRFLLRRPGFPDYPFPVTGFTDEENFNIVKIHDDNFAYSFPLCLSLSVSLSLSFSLARFVPIPLKPESLCCRSLILFTKHLKKYQIIHAFTIIVKIIDFKSFLSRITNIFGSLTSRSITFVRTSCTIHSKGED